MFQQIAKCVGLLAVGSSLWACSASAPSEEASTSTTTEAATAPAPLSCDTAACCPAGTTPVTLTNNPDVLNNATANRCIVALGGSDTIFSSGANSAVLAGDGDDTIMAGAGALVRGGAGRDTINGFTNGTVYGGFGDDTIYSGNGNNFVVPGPGLDNVACGTGDDTVAIYDLCEVTAGEQLAGGTGTNTLITPVSLAQLQARGVTVTGFQKIVVQQNSCKSECVTGNQCSGRGTCIEGSSTGKIKCDCPKGFSGAQCEIVGEPQMPPSVPATIQTAIPGYNPGSLACAPSLVFDNVNAPNFARKISYRTDPVPGCEAQFCSSAGATVAETAVAKPTEAQLNASVAQSSTCPATPGKSLVDCMILPSTAQNVCVADSDCAAGLVCARSCSGPLCATSQRRCGKPADSCTPQPSEGSCDDAGFRMCADQVPGTSAPGDYATALAPSPGTPTGQPAAPNPLRPLATLAEYTRCNGKPVNLPHTMEQISPWQKKDDGSNQFGVYLKPELAHSANFTPIGVGETKFGVSVQATLTAGVKLFGKSFDAIKADAHAKLANCQRDVAATVTVFGDDLVATPGGSVGSTGQTDTCNKALDAWSAGLSEVQIANAQARQAVNLYKATGPSAGFCSTVQTALRDQERTGVKEFLTNVTSSQLDCTSAGLANSSILATNAMVEHLRNVRQQAVDKFKAYGNLRSIYAGGQAFPLASGTPFNLLGGEVDFPIGPLTLTIDGELFGDWGLGGVFAYNFNLGTTSNIGGTAEIGPFVHLNASVFAGIGIPGVSIGVEGSLNLIGVTAKANVGMHLQGQLTADTRQSADWTGDALPDFPSLVATWSAPWEYGAGLTIDSLSGHFDLAARIHLFFFKHTFRKQLFSWNGFHAGFDLTPGGNSGTKQAATPDFGKFGDAQQITEVPMVTPTTPVMNADPNAGLILDLPGEPCVIVK